MAKSKNLRKNKVLAIPKTLEALDRIKTRLGDTDRTDHIEEVESNEQKAKTAILKLSAYGHEGIQLLVKQAKEELAAIVEEINKEPTADLLDPIKFMVHQQGLFATKRVWLWFIGFFADAGEALKEVEAFVSADAIPVVDADY